MAPKNGPPDRWMDYSPMGERISGTRFICMKVPLKQTLSSKIEENDKFSCESAIELASSKGHRLGLVIDLSFTSRYYDPQSFEEKNVAHKKIFMPGRILPKKGIIDSFSESVAKFEGDNEDNDDLIAVHCTHGLNRTGYMICRYLIDKKGFKPEEAIKAFEVARGHKMEREIYLNDLLGKGDKNRPGQTQCPYRGNSGNVRENGRFARSNAYASFGNGCQYSKSHQFDPYQQHPANSRQFVGRYHGHFETDYTQHNATEYGDFAWRAGEYSDDGYASFHHRQRTAYNFHGTDYRHTYQDNRGFTSCPPRNMYCDFESPAKNGKSDYSSYPPLRSFSARPGYQRRDERERDASPYKYSNFPSVTERHRQRYL